MPPANSPGMQADSILIDKRNMVKANLRRALGPRRSEGSWQSEWTVEAAFQVKTSGT